ncbi:hypothetical protein PIB30_097533 [Stylosanthes scabra]|uniref:Uncharacterized protein n=1 Tax=Stylosanthes scabra TaxID=79078 RepID=A0ABU6ZUX2_9FABA|nr:hypothetical protein [Stylosanthes scabra]
MGSGIIYYEIEKCEKYEGSDERADLDLAVVKTPRYHFDDELFIHPLHSIRFDLDRSFELLVESLLPLKRRDPLKKKDSSPQELGPSRRASPTPQYSPLGPVIRLGSPSLPSKIVSPTQGQQGHEGAKPSRVGNSFRHSRVGCARTIMLWGIEEEGKHEEEGEEKEDSGGCPKEDMPAIPQPMDVDANEDYLQYLEDNKSGK